MSDSHRHDYLSTACLHAVCGNCRNTCKFCDSPCQHGCHNMAATAPVWVDQAREMAIALLAQLRRVGILSEAEALVRRIEQDPALFWLRGEVEPVGVWRDRDDI